MSLIKKNNNNNPEFSELHRYLKKKKKWKRGYIQHNVCLEYYGIRPMMKSRTVRINVIYSTERVETKRILWKYIERKKTKKKTDKVEK